MSLFDKAAKVAKTTKEKEPKLKINIDDLDFFNKVEELEKLSDDLKSTKSKADLISDELRSIARNEWVKVYDDIGKNPGTVVIESIFGDKTAHITWQPADKYISITPERAEELKVIYGESIINEETTYQFDKLMIEKYADVLSDLIENCELISESDKENIIKAVTSFSIAKGTIDSLNEYGDVSEVLEFVKPVFSLKNIEVING